MRKNDLRDDFGLDRPQELVRFGSQNFASEDRIVHSDTSTDDRDVVLVFFDGRNIYLKGEICHRDPVLAVGRAFAVIEIEVAP